MRNGRITGLSTPTLSKSSSQRGNALFLILIAVALFAALSYAITQSGRGGGSVSSEQNSILAAQIVQIGADLKAAVQMMILNGTASTSIVANTPSGVDFAGIGSLNGAADFCTTGVNCLFAPEGGGVTVPQVPRNAFLPHVAPYMTGLGWTSYFAGAGSLNGICIDGLSPGSGPSDVSIAGIGTAAVDDIAIFWPLTQGVCAAINKGLGLSGIPLGWAGGAGQESACLDVMGDGSLYLYYQVLVAN